MLTRFSWLAAVSILCVSISPAEEFKLPCAVLPSPLDEIRNTDLEIDQVCGFEGNHNNERKRLENRAKNDFCATNTPIAINFGVLRRLQENADKRADDIKKELKASRKILRSMTTHNGEEIGEGTLVRLVAFLHRAKHSNVGKKKPPRKEGEAVNCNRPQREFNDIHIELVRKANEHNACNSVTAEISPHFRPDSWDRIVKLHLHGRPLRITGPLFFDSSHHPCRPGEKASPQRMSVWEIHPVYNIEVCKNTSLGSCKMDVNAHWTPLHEWEEEGEDEEEPDEPPAA